MANTTVGTRYGSVRGIEGDGCVSFLGVPYASPPTGELRFRPPVDPEPWSGVRNTTEPGLIAPQAETVLAGYVPGDPLAQGEDCLMLNVFAPAIDDGRRPVLVYIHGGAFLIGSGAGVMYRGEQFARRGVVVVTMNYRLGALGFLAHPDLAAGNGGGFGNWGLADQIAALRWVRDHIASFGGDPGNVTLVGESAGAMSAADLLISPQASGLFRRAILESGATLARSPSSAGEVAEQFTTLLGLPGVRRDLLCEVPLAELLEAQAALLTSLGDLGGDAGMPFQPVVDGGVLPVHPDAAIAAGTSNVEALIVGTNRDEFRLFTVGQRQLDELDEPTLEKLVSAYIPPGTAIEAGGLVDAYREASLARAAQLSRRQLFEVIAGDALFRIPALRLVTAHSRIAPTYCYRFDWESPFGGLGLGACHGLELPFVFGTVINPVIGLFSGSSPEALTLSDAIQSSWAAFVSDGDPSVVATGRWPHYDAEHRRTLVFGPDIHLEDAPEEAERWYWEARLDRYGMTRATPGED